jgi:hypothetical protein
MKITQITHWINLIYTQTQEVVEKLVQKIDGFLIKLTVLMVKLDIINLFNQIEVYLPLIKSHVYFLMTHIVIVLLVFGICRTLLEDMSQLDKTAQVHLQPLLNSEKSLLIIETVE